MPKTNVTFLLDRTGSMGSVKEATIEAFNAYLAGLRGTPDLVFSLLQFDSQSTDKSHVRVPINDVPPLNEYSYQPRAGTPLVDASFETIKAVERSLGDDTETKVVICIQTDGQENCSTAHTFAELNALIKEKTALGWQFNFMGCGIDAYAQAERMGVWAGSSMSYDRNSPEKTRAAFASNAANTQAYATGARANTAFSGADRKAAGDAFADPSLMQAPAQPVAPPPTKEKQPKIVDEITL